MKKSNPDKEKKMIIALAILLIITLAVAYSNKDKSLTQREISMYKAVNLRKNCRTLQVMGLQKGLFLSE